MSKHPKLVIIDDDPNQILLMEQILSEIFLPKNIRSFSNPEEGMLHLEREEADIILLDFMMNEMDGLQFLEQISSKSLISQNNERSYFLMVTTEESKETRAQAFKKGIVDYILKPYTPEELKIRIKRILEFRHLESRINALEQIVLKDPLTKLWNKKGLEEELERISQISRRYKMEYAIMMIDLDQFKKYNDTYGHLEGDRVLTKLGDAIISLIRKSDYAGRFGGEEFLIILPYTDESGAFTLGWRILNNIMEQNIPHEKNPPFHKVTFTAGIAIKENDEDVISVIKKADEALYFGKKYSKKVVSFSELVRK